MSGPPDKFISFNTAGMTTDQISSKLALLYSQLYTGPIASKTETDGTTTFFVGGY